MTTIIEVTIAATRVIETSDHTTVAMDTMTAGMGMATGGTSAIDGTVMGPDRRRIIGSQATDGRSTEAVPRRRVCSGKRGGSPGKGKAPVSRGLSASIPGD